MAENLLDAYTVGHESSPPQALQTVRRVYEKIEYVHGNPVRRGLVAVAADWPYSSAYAWETGEDRPMAIDRASPPPLTPQE